MVTTDPYSNSNYRDPDRGFRMWQRDELVTLTGPGKWVPNVNDLVFDPSQGFFIVYEVDYSTGLSKLKTWQIPQQPDVDADNNTLVGVGPGYSSESYRCFLDTSVTPFTLSPDKRLHFYGSMVNHYKVFLGSDISDTYGKVISTFFDPSGNFLGTSVPVEPVLIENTTLNTVLAPMTGYTSERMDDGQLVTLVAYGVDGGVISIAQLLVKNSQAIRQADTSKKYIDGIMLDSPFLSSADPQVIEFPQNVTVESLPMTAVVKYKNGERHRLTIDNNKFSLMGLRNYIATEVGQEFPLVLAYNLADDEISYNLVPSANRRLTLDYVARTIAADGAYSVKIYAYPVWVNASVGFRMEYWLYNLDRQTFYNVTPYVELGTNSNPFNPTEYGTVQTITIALDLNKADGRFAPYRHVQTFQIALLNGGDPRNVNWEILFRPDQEKGYGRNLKADLEFVNVNYWKLRLGNGQLIQETWLKTLYESTEPLFNTASEAIAPAPTHFRVRFLHNVYEYSVSQWNDVLVVNNDLTDGGLVYIEWIKRNYDTDLQLGISALPVLIRES
jgi:hypothetical protein